MDRWYDTSEENDIRDEEDLLFFIAKMTMIGLIGLAITLFII